MKKIIFATGNSHKLREASEILGPGFTIVCAADAGVAEEIPETAGTLAGNALQKARYLSGRTGEMCFADDTGLEVEALGGAPGVYSARYAGPGHDSEANMDKLLAELAALGPGVCRRARFVTHIALILPDGTVHGFEGEMRGEIASARSGSGGFGYDPVFIPDEIPACCVGRPFSGCPGGAVPSGADAGCDGAQECGREAAASAGGAKDLRLVPNTGRLTVSEISEEAKNAISHRGHAMRAMAEWLYSHQG